MACICQCRVSGGRLLCQVCEVDDRVDKKQLEGESLTTNSFDQTSFDGLNQLMEALFILRCAQIEECDALDQL